MNLSNMIEKAGISRKTLAGLMNTTNVTIYRWEKGIHEPDHDALRKLSQILGCSIDDLLNPPQPLTPVNKTPESGAHTKESAA
jgi:transcriptional regulator with XRE-family HTH domain